MCNCVCWEWVDVFVCLSHVLLSVCLDMVCLFLAHLSITCGGKCRVIKMQTTVALLWPQHGIYWIRLFSQSPDWHIFVAAFFFSFSFWKTEQNLNTSATWLSSNPYLVCLWRHDKVLWIRAAVFMYFRKRVMIGSWCSSPSFSFWWLFSSVFVLVMLHSFS